MAGPCEKSNARARGVAKKARNSTINWTTTSFSRRSVLHKSYFIYTVNYFKSSMKCSRLLHANNRVWSPPPTVLYRKEENAWFTGTGLHTRVHEKVLDLLKFSWFSQQAGYNLCEQELIIYTYLKVTNMLKPALICHKQFKTGTSSG
jgi:hypothetical protein